jgi:alkylated DNA nucleotide flippase Atl1
MQLADLTGAGFGPVVRQWALISYLEPYDPITGRCKIWLNVGGSAGHGGLHVVDIDEGVFQKGAELNGRRWAVSVQSGSAAVAAANQSRQAEQAKKKADQAHADREKLREVLNGLPGGETQSALQELSGVPKRRVGQALLALFKDLAVAKCRVVKAAGNDQARHYDGWRSMEGVPRTAAHEQRLRKGELFEAVFAPAAAGGEGLPPAAS